MLFAHGLHLHDTHCLNDQQGFRVSHAEWSHSFYLSKGFEINLFQQKHTIMTKLRRQIIIAQRCPGMSLERRRKAGQLTPVQAYPGSHFVAAECHKVTSTGLQSLVEVVATD